jgi:hypothetical protein
MTRTFASLAAAASLAVLVAPATARAQELQPPPPMQQQPPPPGYETSPPNSAPATINDQESEDSGLGLEWVYLNADAGYGYANLESFSTTTLGMQKTASGGPAVGIGAGVRLLFLTLGLRARDLILDMGNLWELGAEAAFHIRVWHIDPYFGVRGGYNFVGSLDTSTVGTAVGNTSGVSVHGFNVGPMAGIDVYFSHAFSVGADVDAQFLFISRPPVPVPGGLSVSQAVAKAPAQYQAQAQMLYGSSGSSAGIQVTPTIHLGVHF